MTLSLPARTPVGPKRRQVPQLRVGWKRRLAIVITPRSAVLVWDRAPTEIWKRSLGNEANNFNGINRRIADGAQMRPVVA